VPWSSVSENVSPAGTVNELMFTVVHLTALLTSFKEEIVPTQLLLAAEAPAVTIAKEIKVKKGSIAGHITD